jgi:hypothetical protein
MNQSGDNSVNQLPFICATLVITPQDDASGSPPEQKIRAEWCLWDTGVQVSQILGGRLNADIKGNQTSGVAAMAIR